MLCTCTGLEKFVILTDDLRGVLLPLSWYYLAQNSLIPTCEGKSLTSNFVGGGH